MLHSSYISKMRLYKCFCVYICISIAIVALLRLFACQAPLSMGFPQQEYWSGLSFLSPGDLPKPGTELMSPALSGRFFSSVPPGKPHVYILVYIIDIIYNIYNIYIILYI